MWLDFLSAMYFHSCEWRKSFFTSNECIRQQERQGRESFECNVRAVVSF